MAKLPELKDAICAPDKDSPKEDRESFIKIIEHYEQQYEIDQTTK